MRVVVASAGGVWVDGTLWPPAGLVGIVRGVDGWWATDGRSLWTAEDPAGPWSAVAQLPDGVEATALAATPQGVAVGTADAQLLWWDGRELASDVAFAAAPDRDRWYTPWGGPPAVRSLAVGDTLYVNVHVGGILRRTAEGYEPLIDIDTDVHEVRVAEDGTLVAALGVGGLAEWQAGGWRRRTAGLHGTYCRAVATTDTTVLVSASTGPGSRDGRLYVGELGTEEPFRPTGLGGPGNIDTGWVDAAGAVAAAVTPDGILWWSTDAGTTWAELATGLADVRAVRLAV